MKVTRHQQTLVAARRAFAAGDLNAAKHLCEQVVASEGKNAAALFLLGRVLHAMRRFDEAAACLERCARLEPKTAAVHLLLGKVHTDRGKYGAASSRFDRAARIEGNSVDVIRGRAEVFDRRDDHGSVHALLDPIVARGEDDAHMALFLARSLFKEGRSDESIAVLSRHFTDDRTAAGIRRSIGFFLARVHDRRGEYDAAFAACKQANDAEPVEDDADRYRRRVDELIDVFDAEHLARCGRATHGIDLPVLIVGMPRTGSTLVERIIHAHSDAFGAGEILLLQDVPATLGLEIGSTLPYPRCVLDLDADDADRLGRAYVAEMAKLARGKKRVSDKHLLNYENLGLFALLAPRGRVIDCRRNAMDTCLSCYMEPLWPRGHPYATDLGRLGVRYRAYEWLMDHWRKVLDVPMLEVRYEDLVADQERESRRIIDFLGLPWDERCLRFHEARQKAMTLSRDQVDKPLYQTSVGRHEHYAKHLEPLRRALDGR